MKYSRNATSIIEAMIVLLVVVTGITGVYGLLVSSQKLATTTGNRIEAIQIARDGLEAFTNIRDTNWVRFAADYENCWNTLNYDDTCIGTTGTAHRIQGFLDGTNRRPYRIYRNLNNQFELEFVSYADGTLRYTEPLFRDDFRVGYDANDFYTQGASIDRNIDPHFSRYMVISYPNGNSTTDTIRVQSIVQWADSSGTTPHEVMLETILTNWKAKK